MEVRTIFFDSIGIYIFRASFVDKAGIKHYARDYGKRAFKIYIKYW
nr:MAG TPA: MepB protein [Caudoviricetes sp.]